jgi:hypothetical protein
MCNFIHRFGGQQGDKHMTLTREAYLRQQGQQKMQALGQAAERAEWKTGAFSLLQAVQSALNGSNSLEREWSDDEARRSGRTLDSRHQLHIPPSAFLAATQQRDLTAGASAAGGYLVATQAQGFLDVLRARSVVGRLGATQLPDLVGNAALPRELVSTAPTWMTDESTAAPDTPPSFGQVVMTPKTMVATAKFSHQLMLQSAVEPLLRAELLGSCAAELDRVAVAGSGGAGQPTGILNTAGVGTFAGASLGYAGILEAQLDVLSGNGLQGAILGYCCRPSVASLLATRQGFSTLVPLWQGSLDAGQLQGCEAYTSQALPAATLVVGDWSQLLLAQWGAGPVLEVDPYTSFKTGVVAMRVMFSVDVGVRSPAAFSVATGIS